MVSIEVRDEENTSQDTNQGGHAFVFNTLPFSCIVILTAHCLKKGCYYLMSWLYLVLLVFLSHKHRREGVLKEGDKVEVAETSKLWLCRQTHVVASYCLFQQRPSIYLVRTNFGRLIVMIASWPSSSCRLRT
jgi:hypothetical protein